MFYGDNGKITEKFMLDSLIGNYGVHIPQGQWHKLEVLERDTVIFEVKDGFYMPLSSQDIKE